MGEKRYADDIRYFWIAGEVCFDCPCGMDEIILTEAGDTHLCDCGRLYELVHYVTVREMPVLVAAVADVAQGEDEGGDDD